MIDARACQLFGIPYAMQVVFKSALIKSRVYLLWWSAFFQEYSWESFANLNSVQYIPHADWYVNDMKRWWISWGWIEWISYIVHGSFCSLGNERLKTLLKVPLTLNEVNVSRLPQVSRFHEWYQFFFAAAIGKEWWIAEMSSRENEDHCFPCKSM